MKGGEASTKEVFYPKQFGRKFVYTRYVKGQSVLIWPYLLHEPASLSALLSDLQAHGVIPTLYYSERDSDALLQSMVRFNMKYGYAESKALSKAREDLNSVSLNLNNLKAKHPVVSVKIIDPENSDLQLLAEAIDVPVERLEKSRSCHVYQTNEVSRISSSWLVDVYFRMKPFLPTDFLKITRVNCVRSVFFRSAK